MTASRRHKFFSALPYWLLLMLIVFWSVVPIYIVIQSAFKIPRDIFGFPPTLFPSQPTLENFSRLLNDWPVFTRALLNSAIVALATVVLTLVICLPAAYAFSRFRAGVLRQAGGVFVLVGQLRQHRFPQRAFLAGVEQLCRCSGATLCGLAPLARQPGLPGVYRRRTPYRAAGRQLPSRPCQAQCRGTMPVRNDEVATLFQGGDQCGVQRRDMRARLPI